MEVHSTFNNNIGDTMGFDLHGVNPTGEYEDESKAGIYFRNNVWYWRPLWEIVTEICEDLITYKDYKYGHSNDGHQIDADKALQIGIRLREMLEDGTIEEYVKQFNEKETEGYKADKQNIEEFANFSINSGGFSIC